MIGEIDRNVQPPVEGNRLDSVTAGAGPEDGFWLSLSRDAYTSGRDWFDASIRRQVERQLAHFRNQHAPGSKYHTELYQKKSRTFRPKSRSVVRRTEAAVAVAFFATQDLVKVSPVNESRIEQQDGAEVKNELLNYRLQNTIPWFQVLLGGAQDAYVTGVVISKQYWHYETKTQPVINVYDNGDGTESYEEGERRITKNDKPCVNLIALENLILDPASDWIDPINSSPYLIELVPMYVWEIQAKAHRINPRTGRPEYREIDQKFIAAAANNDWDSIRKMRDGNERIDKYDSPQHINQYKTVWVRKMIVRVDGQDWCYDTLGAEIMLSDPEPIEDCYPHLEGKERPYKMGYMNLEAHKMYPLSPLGMLDGMQEEVNDLANLRLDNVKLALNKRTFVKRGAGVDLVTLLRNIPGSAVLMSNPEADVKETQPQDVTASSFQEQDRLNVEFDELAGNFSAGSVSSNRRLQETVGGMSMLSSDANQVKEYEVRTFSETWVEGVMRQMVALEAYYETDEEILDIVAARSGLPLERVVEVLHEPVVTRVDVGFGATNPQQRIGRLIYALDVLGKYRADILQGIDVAQVCKEVFGALGYRDGSRFIPALRGGEDPRISMLTQQVQQLQAALEGRQAEKQLEIQGRIEVANIGAQTKLATTQMQLGVAAQLGELKARVDEARLQLEMIDRQHDAETNDTKRRELYLQREALSHEIQRDNREFMLQLRQAADGQKGDGPKKVKGGAAVISRDRYGMVPGQSDGVNPP